jgi:predicted MFS family arabinose efflux permease
VHGPDWQQLPLAVRQVALSRYIGVTLVGQLVGASLGGILAEWIGWRGVLGCAAALAVMAAATAFVLLPRSGSRGPAPFSRAEDLSPCALPHLQQRFSGRCEGISHHAVRS